MAKTDLLAIASPGSRALKNAKHEKYCRLRASLQPRGQAYREAGWETSDDGDAYSNACRLERRPGVRARIEYLSHQAEELIAEKRRRIEEALWSMHEADIGNFFETVEVAKNDKDGKLATDEAGKMLTIKKQRPRLLSDLPPELRKVIERVQIDARGNVVPQLYSKAQASADLRKMLNIGRTEDRPESDVARLSDAELIQQLADQAKQLGVEIKLDYSFAQQAPATEAPDPRGETIDHEPVAAEAGNKAAGGTAAAVKKAADVNSDAAAVDAARDLRIGLSPAVAGARRIKGGRR
jgi:hypothetical protein